MPPYELPRVGHFILCQNINYYLKSTYRISTTGNKDSSTTLYLQRLRHGTDWMNKLDNLINESFPFILHSVSFSFSVFSLRSQSEHSVRCRSLSSLSFSVTYFHVQYWVNHPVDIWLCCGISHEGSKGTGI